jgi:hypothetical protein
MFGEYKAQGKDLKKHLNCVEDLEEQIKLREDIIRSAFQRVLYSESQAIPDDDE